MKKSTLMATLALAACFVTLTAANLELKREYTRGNIRSGYTTTLTAPFHYIHEDMDSSFFGLIGLIQVTSDAGQKPSFSTFGDNENGFELHVVNDTLYIRADNTKMHKFSPITSTIIMTEGLKGISVGKVRYHLTVSGSPALSITAAEQSEVKCDIAKIDSLNIHASSSAKIAMSGSDTLSHAVIRLDDKSSFAPGDLIFRQKELQISDKATLELTGKGMQSF